MTTTDDLEGKPALDGHVGAEPGDLGRVRKKRIRRSSLFFLDRGGFWGK
jgi:hypothetical protein